MKAIAQQTIDVMPLGRPGRYSMTPAMQRVYLACVALADRGIVPNIYQIREQTGISGNGSILMQLGELEERGWVTVRRSSTKWIVELVEPVLRDLKPCR